MYKSLILIFLLLVPSISFAQVTIGPNSWIQGIQNVGIGTDNAQERVHIQNGNIKIVNGGFIGDGSQIINLPAVALTVTPGVSHSLVSSTSATGFQISSTKPAMAFYSVKITTTANISGGQEGEVYLETAATNSTTPSDWSTVTKVSNGQTFSLAIALQGVQPLSQVLIGMVPAGYYARLRSNNVTGTPAYSYVTGQETVIG